MVSYDGSLTALRFSLLRLVAPLQQGFPRLLTLTSPLTAWRGPAHVNIGLGLSWAARPITAGWASWSRSSSIRRFPGKLTAVCIHHLLPAIDSSSVCPLIPSLIFWLQFHARNRLIAQWDWYRWLISGNCSFSAHGWFSSSLFTDAASQDPVLGIVVQVSYIMPLLKIQAFSRFGRNREW